MEVSLHSEAPRAPLRPQLDDLVHDATRVDLAIAFVTHAGVDAILKLVRKLKNQAKVRLVVSVLFPTDLDAVAVLAKEIDVHIHLARQEEREGIHGQFHSKIIYIERQGELRTIVVGSHNWTRNGLDGHNWEASLIIDCVETDPVVSQTRGHIAMCRHDSKEFSADDLTLYKAIQRDYHHNLTKTIARKLPGFEKHLGIVVLAEGDFKSIRNSGDVYFRVPTASEDSFNRNTKVWFFVYPKGKLFGCGFPLPKPRLLVGEVLALDARPNELLGIDDNSYVIRDLSKPYLQTFKSAPKGSGDDSPVVVSFEEQDNCDPIPLFHSGGEPRLSLHVETSPEEETCEQSFKDPLDSDDSRQLVLPQVPSGLIAATNLEVPFQFAYPPTLKDVLESYSRRNPPFDEDLECRVELDQAHSITDYVCHVKVRSNADLSQAIYSPSRMKQ